MREISGLAKFGYFCVGLFGGLFGVLAAWFMGKDGWGWSEGGKLFAEIGEDYRAQSIMIGDSLSSDMQGGRNAGIPTCLYGRTEPISPLCDYAVADLLELPALLAPL